MVVTRPGAIHVGTISAPLFVPGDRPERFAKAAQSGADAIIVDLEDAVASADKDRARASLAAINGVQRVPVIVRVNAAGTAWHEDDLHAVATLPIAAIMLPKSETVADAVSVAAVHPVVALIETAAGLANARTIAASGAVARLAFGSIDYAADLGCDHVREALATARAELVLAARLAGLPAPLDGVTTAIDDPDTIAEDARYSRAMGFGGKLLIHPRQVAPALRGLAPDPREVDWADRVLATTGAARVDGAMVDEPVRLRARAILARAAATAS